MKIKDELYIKSIDKESYSSVAAYLNELYSIAGILYNPMIICFNGRKFIVEKFAEGNGKGYAIVEDANDNLKTYGFVLDEENQEKLIITDDYQIDIDLDDEEPKIDKTDLSTLERESLFHKRYPDESALIYTKYNPNTNLGFDMKYKTNTNRNSLSYMINWLNYKTPDMIDFLKIKGYKVKTISTYLKTDSGNYTRSIIRIPFLGYYGTNRKVIDKNTMDAIIDNYGFKMNIPTDMTSILNQNNEDVKALKLVARSYEFHNKN